MKRGDATLNVLVQLEDAFELNAIGEGLNIITPSEATFEYEGWEMTMKLTARRKKATPSPGGDESSTLPA